MLTVGDLRKNVCAAGYTFNVPDSVMSLTFIAFGVSLPDVVTSVLVVRDGKMGRWYH